MSNEKRMGMKESLDAHCERFLNEIKKTSDDVIVEAPVADDIITEGSINNDDVEEANDIVKRWQSLAGIN